MLKTNRPVTYGLTNSSGEIIEDIFHRQELSPVIIDIKNIYAVEKVLMEQQRKHGKYLFIKWRDYPEVRIYLIQSRDFSSVKQAS